MIAVHAHEPNAAGTACEGCGLAAEPVDPDELAALLIAELIAAGAIDPRDALDAGVVVLDPPARACSTPGCERAVAPDHAMCPSCALAIFDQRVMPRMVAAPTAVVCHSIDPSECAMIRERSVAGISNAIPPCLVHGPYVDETDR